MTMKKWHELPLKVRKSKKEMYKYMYEQITGEPHDGSDDPSPSPEPVTRDISVTVDDGTDPVQGASVVIGETSKTTGSAGGCSFTGLADGTYNVTVTKEGYTDKTEEITVSENNTSFTISLTAAVDAEAEEE